ncbi:MAG: T9SS type A sorting domain-containing protein [Bacteroidetes bacterium]|nr:T9SS type A sorting domain-containing protein [Bacteroidota bacterium]
MKKFLFTFSFFLITCVTASSQLVFERVGGDTTYGSTGANYAYAYFTNSGSSPVSVRFDRVQDQLPNASWTSSICVGLCYAPFISVVPDTSTINGPEPPVTIMPGERDTMDITFDAPNLGIAHIIVRMYKDDEPSVYVERDFVLNVNTVGINNISTQAENYTLSQNYPNPFNPVTNIEFSIPRSENVTLKVYDILGNEVSVLLNNEKLNSGSYKTNFSGNSLTSGIYYYKLTAGSFSDTKKMMLIK